MAFNLSGCYFVAFPFAAPHPRFSLFVFWADGTSTNFFVGLLYIVANAFCLWSIIECIGNLAGKFERALRTDVRLT